MAGKDVTSQGSFGLSHFRSSRAAQALYEPIYQNLFTIQIQLPVGVGSSDENTNLILENVRNIGGLQSHSFPTTPLDQKYKWASRRFAGAKPDTTTMDLTITFEVNLQNEDEGGNPSAYVLKTLRKWSDLVYDPLTGRTGLKEDYVSPYTIITLYDRAAKPFWQWKLYYAFPTTQITAPGLDYDSEDLYKITDWGLACDYWDESIV